MKSPKILNCAKKKIPFFLLFTANLSTIKDKLEECREFGIDLVIEMEEYLSEMNLSGTGTNKAGIALLEQNIMDVGSWDKVAQGVFYLLPIFYHNKLFVRYIETGIYCGFISTAIEMLKKHYKVRDAHILPWNVFTQYDTEYHISQGTKKSKTRKKIFNQTFKYFFPYLFIYL